MILREKIDIEKLESHPNINRNIQLGIGKGRELTDTKLIDELFEVLTKWIK